MDSVLQMGPVKFTRRGVFGFYLIGLAVVSNACTNYQTSCVSTPISVEEGESIRMPFKNSENPPDLCLWNNSTSTWDNACHFSHGVCQHLLTAFREHVLLEGKILVFQNVSKNATGIYRLEDISGHCVASIHVSVLDRKDAPLPTVSPTKSQSSTIKLESSVVIWAYFLLSVPAFVAAAAIPP